MSWLKNISYPYMLSGKLYIRNNWQGLQQCSPCSYFVYRLIRYSLVDRKMIIKSVL